MSAQYKNSSNWPADEPPLYARQQKRTTAEKEVRFPRTIGQETVRKQRGVLTDQDLDDLRVPADPEQPSCGHFRPAASHIKMWLADGFREWCPECNKLTGQNVIRPNSERSGNLKYLKSQEEKRQLEMKSEVDTQTTTSDPWLTASEEKSWTSSDYTPVNPDYNDDAIRSIWPPEQRASLLTNFQRRQLEAAGEQQRLLAAHHQVMSRVMEVIDDKTSSDELSSDSEYRRAIRDHPLPMPGQRDHFQHSISDRQPVQIPLDAYGRPLVNNRAANHIAHPRDPHVNL
ncbi:hypothetical protein M3Y99_01049600 [Aphelenchoides fujianensis]|nr:hypothetical protein M3Y99_01049600 [Aphelenchoides fujianensis]